MTDKNQPVRNIMSTQIKHNDDIIEICVSGGEAAKIVKRVLLKCYNSNHAIRLILENLK